MTTYRELESCDIICEGDEFYLDGHDREFPNEADRWLKCTDITIGRKVGSRRTRRPVATVAKSWEGKSLTEHIYD